MCKRILAILLFISVFSSAFVQAENRPLKDEFPSSQYNGAYEDDSITYQSYLSANKNFSNVSDGVKVALDISKSKLYNKLDNNTNGIKWETNETKTIDLDFSVSQEGFYELEIEYLTPKSTATSPTRNIKVDGKTLYKQMNNIEFKRLWKDDGKPFKNPVGDDIRPQISEVYSWQTTRIYDCDGLYASPLKFALSKGIHTISFEYVYEPLYIKSISFVSPKILPTYEEKLKEYKEKNYSNSNDTIKIDAEYPAYKSDSVIRMEYCLDPMADPRPKGENILNVLGGTSWNKPNQTVTYKFYAKKPGLYKLNLRMYQKYASGLPSYRQIRIDGEIPFSEFESYEIKHTDWVYTSLESKKDSPYLIYLNEGDHTISLTSKMNGYNEVFIYLNSTLDRLSYIIRKIIMITSVSPDPSLDYQLDKKIPDLMDTLKQISTSLSNQINAINKLSGKNRATSTSGLIKVKIDIDNMIKNPLIIASKLTDLKNDQISLSSWTNTYSSSGLLLDYLTFDSPDKEVKNYSSNIFQTIFYSFKSFIASFYKDYDSINGITATNVNGTKKSLKVWVSRGKEWGDVLKQLCDENYSRKYSTSIDLNIFPPGNLGTSGVVMLSIASGSAPDVILGGDGSLAAEYGMRDAVVDLKQFDDFNEVSKQFLPGVFKLFAFKNEIFALPETMDFSVMYYRKDLLKELNLEIPQTWDDLYKKVLPVLKRNSMDFWYEGGLNTFLYQNGGDLYKDGGLKSALDSPEAMDAFKQFTDLYRVYEIPVTADFYSRFRIGQMPIGISSFNTYIKFTSAAPEINGKWAVAPIPGTKDKEGNINRSSGGSCTGCIILKGAKDKPEAWNFIKWYTNAETQETYARNLAAFIGSEARWFSANIQAFNSLPWENNLREVMNIQMRWITNPYNVVGGYITARHVENARVRTVIQGMNYRESMDVSVKNINRELLMKNQEFQLVAKSNAKKGKQ